MINIEKRLKETADMIETAVKDINEKKATKQEVLDLIEDRRTEDKEVLDVARADIDKLNSGVAELNAAAKDFQKKLLQLRQGKLADPAGSRNYTGNFSSPQEAKTFAYLVIAAATGSSNKLAGQHKAAMDYLEKAGVDPYWVTPAGRKDMTGSAQTGGSALVTIEQSPAIIMLLEKYGKYRANARNLPMGAGSTTMPKIDGLLEVTCPGEGGTATEKDPEIKVVSLNPKTLLALTGYSIELEDDAMVALGELLADLFTRSFAYYEDLCGFLGDGTSTYFGYKGIAGALMAVDATIGNIKSLVVGSGNAYSELVLGDFGKVPGTLPDLADDGDAKWYEHRYFYYTVFVALALAAGGTPATEIILGAGQRQKMQLGYPVEFTQVMPKAEANSQICALLANLRQGTYLGVRGGLEFASSSDVYFDKGLIAVRGRDRVAINVHGVGDTTDAGPICGLITAAS